MPQCRQSRPWTIGRRGVVGIGIAIAPFLGRPVAAADEAGLPPQPGDRFTYVVGEKKNQLIKASDLPLGGPQIQAYPIDIKTGVVRDGSRLNLLLLSRFDPSSLSEETRARSAQGVVAYSGVCTHQGCPVTMWSSSSKVFFCSCHGSTYDPKDGAEVTGGPAPRPLPSLALAMKDDIPFVAEGFTARVGPEKH